MYFDNFPIIPYPFYRGNDKNFTVAINIMRRVAFSSTLNNTASFYEYHIKDGERPDQIANKIYGNPEYHWVVLLANDIFDPYHAWCKSQSSLEEYTNTKYSGSNVYFTDLENTLLFNSVFLSGCTLQQGSMSDSIVTYRDTFCELRVNQPGFQTGNAEVVVPGGSTVNIYIHKTTTTGLGVYNFVLERPAAGITGSNGAQEITIVDPLQKQTADYVEYGTVLGNKIPNLVVNGLSGSVVLFDQTYIGRYMGVSGPQVTTYAVTNRANEYDLNERKRKIKLLKPQFVTKIIQQFSAIMGNR